MPEPLSVRTYRGYREGPTAIDEVAVMVTYQDGTTIGLPHRCVKGVHRCHSPSGFNWGYPGSGPSELARAILWDLLDAEPHPSLYQSFKARYVARWPEDGSWDIPSEVILAWLGAPHLDPRLLLPGDGLVPGPNWRPILEQEMALRQALGLDPGPAADDLGFLDEMARREAEEAVAHDCATDHPPLYIDQEFMQKRIKAEEDRRNREAQRQIQDDDEARADREWGPGGLYAKIDPQP